MKLFKLFLPIALLTSFVGVNAMETGGKGEEPAADKAKLASLYGRIERFVPELIRRRYLTDAICRLEKQRRAEVCLDAMSRILDAGGDYSPEAPAVTSRRGRRTIAEITLEDAKRILARFEKTLKGDLEKTKRREKRDGAKGALAEAGDKAKAERGRRRITAAERDAAVKAGRAKAIGKSKKA